jgi:uncharacterized protein YdeI (YjbR/CyaY-like superfamily)
MKMKQLDQVLIESPTQLRSWLETHHQQASSVWLVKWKKTSGKPFISYDEIVDQLICFGWVDSLPRKLDEARTMLLISPRNPNSNWSAVNKKRVEKMKQAGLMTRAGWLMVEQARKNGSWDFLTEVDQLRVPDDLEKALQSVPQARSYFNRFPDSSKRGILEWIKSAKTAGTRQKRIAETAKKAGQNLKANFPPGRDRGPR